MNGCGPGRWLARHAVVLQCECRLLAQSGQATTSALCLFLGVKRTNSKQDALSAYDPKRTLRGLKSRSAAVLRRMACAIVSVAASAAVGGAPDSIRTIEVCPRTSCPFCGRLRAR